MSGDVGQVQCPVNEQCLAEILKNNHTTKGYEILYMTTSNVQGQGFLSHIFEISVGGRKLDTNDNENRDFCQSFISKSPLPPNDPVGQTVDSTAVFKNEVHAYNKMIPFFRDNFEEDYIRVFPYCYWADDSYIVQHNLGRLGFVKVSKRTGLDNVHCEMVLRKIANIHAMSLIAENTTDDTVLKLKYREVKKDMPEQVYLRGKTKILDTVKGVFDRMKSILEGVDLKPEEKKTLNIIMQSKEKIFHHTCRVLEKGQNRVLTHGDFYINNMMFKYNEKHELKDVKILDLQTVSESPLARDLVYFFINNRFHVEYSEEANKILVQKYCEQFNKTIDEMNKKYPINPKLTLERNSVLKQMAELNIYKFLTATWMAALLLCDDPFHPENWSDEENQKMKTEYRKLLEMFRKDELAKLLRKPDGS